MSFREKSGKTAIYHVKCVDEAEYPDAFCTESRLFWWKGGESSRAKIPSEQAVEQQYAQYADSVATVISQSLSGCQ